MTDLYTGNDRRYTGNQVDITYNIKRCIHAEYCVKHLSDVFDKQKRPWINADGAPVEDVAAVIEQCPSGALHYDRKDGNNEATPEQNTIIIRHNGPLEVRGDLTIHGTTVALEHETRVTLCRCGGSKNKPFCDNTHKEIGFEAGEREPIEGSAERSGGKLIITAETNGPLEFQGEVEILNESQETLFKGNNTALCRCGQSSNKPFCDSTHQRIGFKAE
ncbi:MAG: CDGSH iron-sulfur domain-containing protein [Anaerolineae bacterium]|nr:CDGSH iron-sulfur domain-containing protein [Anaerolineae bacterium]